MSGICGIVHLDGAPVDAGRIEALTASLAFRGPDARGIWSDGAAALGHTLLRTTFDMARESQPVSLEGRVWIAADARIDARAELERSLAAKGRPGLGAASDPELILHAYEAWGEDFVTHLLGDFAFALWDARRERLVCARDHFGVKPFFYARVGSRLIFSNTLECVRAHPAVSSALDELSIADFLLFDMNQDPAATAFRDIRRLPPGSCLIASRRGLEVREYWTLPLGARVRYRARGDYVEHFKELLETAVADRMRTDRLGVELTGGLDSTSIAATARGLAARESRPVEMHALTFVYDRLIPDEERRYASLAGERLGIPIHFFARDGFGLYERCEDPAHRFPEPTHEPCAAAGFDAFRTMASFGRVALTGWDGDALFNESPKPYFVSLLRERRMGRLLAGMVRYGVSQRRIVPLTVRNWLAPGRVPAQAAPYPVWLNAAFEARLDLRGRWARTRAEPEVSHPLRPYAFRSLAHVRRLSNFFEHCDPGITRVPLEYRHPLMDLRLQEYCLSLPPMPWCVKKSIVRDAMRGILPEEVRRRPKAPLAGWPEMELMRQPEAQWIDRFTPAPGLAEYVDRDRVPALAAAPDREARWSNLRPLSLSFWLRNLEGRSP